MPSGFEYLCTIYEYIIYTIYIQISYVSISSRMSTAIRNLVTYSNIHSAVSIIRAVKQFSGQFIYLFHVLYCCRS